MIVINDGVGKLGDDVFIRGIDLSQPFNPMTDSELSIEQQQEEDRGEDESLIEAVTELLWGIVYLMIPVERGSCS